MYVKVRSLLPMGRKASERWDNMADFTRQELFNLQLSVSARITQVEDTLRKGEEAKAPLSTCNYIGATWRS